MKLYNVEVFQGFNYRSSAQLESVEYKEDYISPEKNKVKTSLPQFWAEKGDYIHISGPDIDSLGVVTQVQETKGQKQVTYEQFLTLFDINIFCDFSVMDTMTIEKFLAEQIKTYFMENEDILQNISGLDIQVLSETNGTLALEDNIVNLLEDIIIPAFETFQIVVTPEWDIMGRKILLKIQKCNTGIKTIEADLPNIFDKNLVLRRTKNDLNKVVVINEENQEERITVYRTIGGEITTKDADRIEPVVAEYMTAKASRQKAFATVALEKAENKLRKAEYENLVELEMKIQDSLINPGDMSLGQVVQIISDGIAYTSILTGRQIKDTEKLVFGMVRMDLTKVIRRR